MAYENKHCRHLQLYIYNPNKDIGNRFDFTIGSRRRFVNAVYGATEIESLAVTPNWQINIFHYFTESSKMKRPLINLGRLQSWYSFTFGNLFSYCPAT